MMSKKVSFVMVIIVMCFSFIVTTGCRSKVKQSGFLTDYPTFEKGPSGGVNLRYLKQGVDFSNYDKIMMDQVVFYFSKDSKYKGMNSDELNQLSEAFHKAMVKELQDAYPFVQEAGPGVLRVRPAITDVKGSRPVLNTISTVLPAGLALSIVKKGVTGTHMNVGEASIEVEFLDAQTNDRIAAVIDKRSGAKYKVLKGMRKWGHAKDAFNYWAKRLRKFLDEAHGK
jgi:hypothetical protein